MKKSIFLGFVLCLAVMAVGNNAKAGGLNDQMDDIFGSMVNVTDPTAYKDSRRGVISGGGLVMRNQIWNQDLIGFVPASIDAGCGGVDFFAGSFSYINADQIIQLFRSIASNAGGYAFKLALGAMCPSCEQTIDSLEKAIRDLNAKANNSCKIAKGLVDSFDVQENGERLSDGLEIGPLASLSTALGRATDSFSSTLDNIGKNSNAEPITEAELYASQITGNVVWRALTEESGVLEEAPMDSWFAWSGDDLAEAMMSMVGTIVYIKEDSGIPPIPYYYPGIMSLRDMVSSELPRPEVKIYKCDENEKCMYPKKANLPTGVSNMYEMVEDVLLGTETSPGVVYKMVTNSGAFTAQEKSMMEMVPEHAKRLRDLAIFSPGSAATYARMASEKIALDLISRLFYESVDAMQLAVTQNGHTLASDALARIRETRDKIMKEESLINEQISKKGSLTAIYSDLMQGSNKVAIDLLSTYPAKD